MKLRKKIFAGIIILLMIIITLVTVVIMHLGSIVAKATRTFGTRAAGTEVAVKSVYVSLLGGGLKINNLSVDNPSGYKNREALSFDLVSVEVDVNSVFTDTIIVDKVEIANLKVDFEPTLAGGSNLNDIKNNIKKFTESLKAAEEGEDDKAKEREDEIEEPDPSGETRKVVIKSLVINKGEIMVSSSMLNTTAGVPLPRIELNDLGEESNLGEAVGEIFDEILESVVKTVASANIEGLDLGKMTKDVPDTVEKVGRDIGKTIKGIFE